MSAPCGTCGAVLNSVSASAGLLKNIIAFPALFVRERRQAQNASQHPLKHAFILNSSTPRYLHHSRLSVLIRRTSALKKFGVAKAVCRKRLPKMSIVFSLLTLLLSVHMCYSAALSPTG